MSQSGDYVNLTVAKSLHQKAGKVLPMADFRDIMPTNEEFTKSELLPGCHSCKRSASGILLKARKDSGRAGMTDCAQRTSDRAFCNVRVNRSFPVKNMLLLALKRFTTVAQIKFFSTHPCDIGLMTIDCNST
jgi:hypothetical protein